MPPAGWAGLGLPTGLASLLVCSSACPPACQADKIAWLPGCVHCSLAGCQGARQAARPPKPPSPGPLAAPGRLSQRRPKASPASSMEKRKRRSSSCGQDRPVHRRGARRRARPRRNASGQRGGSCSPKELAANTLNCTSACCVPHPDLRVEASKGSWVGRQEP